MKLLRRRQKKAHIMEVQLNGGSIADKVNFARRQGVRPGRDDRCHWSDQGSRIQGRDQQVAHQEAPKEDSQGSQEGCLYWSLASQQNPEHRAQGWTEGLPPQD